MTTSDRLYLFLAEGTPQYDQLVAIVGEPSSASPSKSPSQKEMDKRLAVYGDVPVSTFSILS